MGGVQKERKTNEHPKHYKVRLTCRFCNGGDSSTPPDCDQLKEDILTLERVEISQISEYGGNTEE